MRKTKTKMICWLVFEVIELVTFPDVRHSCESQYHKRDVLLKIPSRGGALPQKQSWKMDSEGPTFDAKNKFFCPRKRQVYNNIIAWFWGVNMTHPATCTQDKRTIKWSTFHQISRINRGPVYVADTVTESSHCISQQLSIISRWRNGGRL